MSAPLLRSPGNCSPIRPAWLRIAAAAAALAAMGAVTWLSSQSMPELPEGPWSWSDKLTHGSVWTVIAGLLALAAPRPQRRAALVATAIAIAFGAADEYHQSFTPGRDASWLDLLADTVGGAIGAAVVTWYGARRCPAPPSSASAATSPASPPTSSSPITSR